MDWKLASDRDLVRYFEQENVWTKRWTAVGGEIVTVSVSGGEAVALRLWEATFKGVVKRFAADEVSNGVWAFALPG